MVELNAIVKLFVKAKYYFNLTPSRLNQAQIVNYGIPR